VEHFLEYWTPQVDKFLITLNQRVKDQEQLERYEAILAKFGIRMHRFWEGDFDSLRKQRYLAEDFKQGKPTDWMLTLDSDEFYILPVKVSKYLEDVSSAGYNCVLGRFVDRVDHEGRLKVIGPEPLDLQFPVTCQIAKLIHGPTTCTDKVFAARPFLRLSGGHHKAYGNPHPTVLDTHHFKWDSLLLERMRQRLDITIRNKVSYLWDKQCKAGLEYMTKHGKIEPQLILDNRVECDYVRLRVSS
jgi:hypothetical protein